jgi:hypothetical protein
MKVHSNLSIDAEVIEKAKEKGINISEAAEIGIRNQLSQEIKAQKLLCAFCGIELPKQTVDDLTKGLCWLWPDEKWICPECLNKKKHKVIIGVTENV